MCTVVEVSYKDTTVDVVVTYGLASCLSPPKFPQLPIG